jgi:lipopolysaccharide export system protein LptA
VIQRIRDYVIAFAVVLAAYLLYAQTVVRLIEPKPIARTSSDENGPWDPPSPRNPYAHLFQPGDWELDSPKILETNGGTLIFHDYHPLDQGRLEIRPCTLILYSRDEDKEEMSQSGRPIVMRAHEGAVLQFDEDLDLARGQFGRLIGGRILGDIRLFSPESAPGAGDGLELTTRNLQIDRLRAWTPHEVKFRYGSSYGSGQDLVMNLSPSEAIAKGKAKAPPIGGVESVQLSQVKEIHLEPKQGSVLPSAGEATDKPAAKQPPVRITCDGPLRFDVTRRVATFDDNVLVQRLLPNAPADRLHCEQLAIFLASADAPKPKPSATQSLPVSTGNIERIVAVGKPVVLDAPSQSAHTEAERLEYNLQTRQVLLKSLNSGARVLLRRATDEFSAPELAYELVEGRRIGKLWAPGPGRLLSSTGVGNDQRTFSAQWKKELRIRPHEANQLLSLTDGARIDVQGQGSFEADELHFWLLEIPDTDSKSSGDGLAGMGQGRIVPDRLLATGHVQAISPQLSAEVERLEAWFQQVPVELPAAAPVEQTPPADQLILGPAAGPTVREPTRPIVRIQEPLPSPSGSPLNAPTVDPSKPVQHFHVTGEIVRMQVVQSGKQSSVEQISVEGEKVRITETNAEEGQEPLWLAGTKLDLEGGTGPNALITVSGEPAIVSARGMSLRSKTLKLSRRDNRVTVEQEGSMTLPMQQDFQGQKLPDAEQLAIAWKGSMVFDGLTAKFRRNVSVRGTTFWATSDELQAMLTSRIDFSRSNQSGKSPEIKRLTLAGGAELENRSFHPENGRQQSVERMAAHSLEVDQVSGAIHGVGPGWLSRIQVGSPALPGAGAGSMPPSQESDSSAGLTYLQVDFRQGLEGNLKQRQITFGDQVQCVFGPVSHWEDKMDPNSRDALGERGMILTSDRLQLAEFLPPGAKKGSLEMTATGNTRVEGRDFTAWSHRLAYTAAKSQLVLEGDGRNEAEIRHQFQNSVAAQKIFYWQDTNAIQIDGAKSINIGPTSSRPLAPPRSPRDAVQPR